MLCLWPPLWLILSTSKESLFPFFFRSVDFSCQANGSVILKTNIYFAENAMLKELASQNHLKRPHVIHLVNHQMSLLAVFHVPDLAFCVDAISEKRMSDIWHDIHKKLQCNNIIVTCQCFCYCKSQDTVQCLQHLTALCILQSKRRTTDHHCLNFNYTQITLIYC